MNRSGLKKLLIPTILLIIAVAVIAVSVFNETEVQYEADNDSQSVEPADAVDIPFHIELEALLSKQSKIELVYTEYVPGDGFYIYTEVQEQNRENLLDWANAQLIDFKTEFREYPKAEQLMWIIDFADGRLSEIIIVPISRAADPNFYHYLEIDVIPGEHFSLLPEGILLDLILDFDVNKEIALGEDSKPIEEAEPEIVVDFVNPVLSFRETFDSDLTNWRTISGSWEVRDGVVVQTLLEGFDYTLMLDQPVLERFTFQTEIKYIAGNGGGGVIFNAPTFGERVNAYVMDFVEDGRFLRWGYFDAEGNYNYIDGGEIENNLSDGLWHELMIENDGATTTIYFDAIEVVTLENRVQGGSIGLFVSQAEIEFDNVDLARLPGEINESISQNN